MVVQDRIRDQISKHPVLIYMKGSPQFPMCGFSAKTVEALKQCGKPFAFVDVIADSEIRATLPSVSDWPTFPQIFIQGELVGGCDIAMQMFESGDLQKMIEEAVPSNDEES